MKVVYADRAACAPVRRTELPRGGGLKYGRNPLSLLTGPLISGIGPGEGTTIS